MTRALALAGLVALAATLTGCTEGDDIEWVAAARSDLLIGVEVSGALQAIDSSPVKPPPVANKWNFKIVRLAPEGSVVAEGDPVVTFDASDLARELDRMNNDADAAEAEIGKARGAAALAREDETLKVAEYEAALGKRELLADQPRDLKASLELEAAALDRRLAELDLTNARARAALAKTTDAAQLRGLRDRLAYARGRVAQIQAGIARMTVRARRAGTVIHPTNWRGEKSKTGDTVWRMQTVLEIVSVDRMKGAGEVDEVDSSKIEVGQRVTLRVDAHSDRELVGRLSEIADSFQPKSEADPSKVVKVGVELDDFGDTALRPGMRFRGSIETSRVAGTVVVPAKAVFVTPSGPVAYVRAGSDYREVPVIVGARSRTEVAITDGVEPGDEVALSHPEMRP